MMSHTLKVSYIFTVEHILWGTLCNKHVDKVGFVQYKTIRQTIQLLCYVFVVLGVNV